MLLYFYLIPKLIFAKLLLASRKQQSGETIEPFYQFLHIFQDCGQRNVTGEEYKNELVQNAFINGLSSHSIRHRLLAKYQLIVTQTFDFERSLRTAEDHFEAYLTIAKVASTVLQASHPDSVTVK